MTEAPKSFHRFAEAVMQDIHLFKTKAEFFRFALGRMSSAERGEFEEFVDRLNAGEISDRDLQASWNSSAADLLFPDPIDLHRFLTEAATYAKVVPPRHRFGR
ncbi:hypothetical protein GCM10011390_11730 [Aureimonas endophytica]|uniref:Uncharacterized protein n=1 Tax=Aureimonas endophytica TaxID=2027858 RepID=A0A917E2K0_9HYPH|nr:hypothetical protein [Aureimonas endophytica]GGD94612.1 hypothetical protein GCM10011390_11730 [Aureimonas endophytica]